MIRFRKELAADLIYNVENIAAKCSLEIGRTTSEIDLIDCCDNFRYNVEDFKLAIRGGQNFGYVEMDNYDTSAFEHNLEMTEELKEEEEEQQKKEELRKKADEELKPEEEEQ